MKLERLSIELTNRCDKGCGFCYNDSRPDGDTRWTVDEIISLVTDCASHDVRAVSLGGGEPLQYDGVYELLEALQDRVFRSITTNGLRLLDQCVFDRLVAAKPDKVHVSLHRPGSASEVERVVHTVLKLEAAGIVSGVNVLVSADQLDSAAQAASVLHGAGIDNRRIVYLPQQGSKTPTPKQLAAVATGPFQSMSCLTACAPSPRFCSISWDKTVAWCSYTVARRPLQEVSYAGVMAALRGLGLRYCGESKPEVIAMVARPSIVPRRAIQDQKNGY